MTNEKKRVNSRATHTLRQSINWKYPNRPYPSVIVILSVKKRRLYYIQNNAAGAAGSLLFSIS
jgi:hypothetical protein